MQKRLSLAAGPNPAYRGFVGKVLAGPTEKPVSGTGSAGPSPSTESRATPRGEPGLRSASAPIPEDRTTREGGIASGLREQRRLGEGSSSSGQEGRAGFAMGEDGRNLGERSERVELTKRFVPPGWRPLMRADPCEPGPSDVITDVDRVSPEGTQSTTATTREVANRDLPTSASPLVESSALTASQPEPFVPVLLNSAALTVKPAKFNPGTSCLGSPYPEASQYQAAQPTSSVPGSQNLDSVAPLPTRPVTPPGRSQYGSLAEAFGSVLDPPGKKPFPECGPPRKKSRSEPESGPGTKTPSWLDWRNEADPGLPPGAPSPGHISPGQTARGKLPGHWSDVRQVRFQAPAPEGVLKTTEKLDFGADVAGSDWLLLVGSHVAAEVREAVWAEVGCRCSAGVAHNKMLAKLASPMNKPNGQTTMLTGAVAGHIRNLPARKVRGRIFFRACSSAFPYSTFRVSVLVGVTTLICTR